MGTYIALHPSVLSQLAPTAVLAAACGPSLSYDSPALQLCSVACPFCELTEADDELIRFSFPPPIYDHPNL